MAIKLFMFFRNVSSATPALQRPAEHPNPTSELQLFNLTDTPTPSPNESPSTHPTHLLVVHPTQSPLPIINDDFPRTDDIPITDDPRWPMHPTLDPTRSPFWHQTAHPTFATDDRLNDDILLPMQPTVHPTRSPIRRPTAHPTYIVSDDYYNDDIPWFPKQPTRTPARSPLHQTFVPTRFPSFHPSNVPSTTPTLDFVPHHNTNHIELPQIAMILIVALGAGTFLSLAGYFLWSCLSGPAANNNHPENPGNTGHAYAPAAAEAPVEIEMTHPPIERKHPVAINGLGSAERFGTIRLPGTQIVTELNQLWTPLLSNAFIDDCFESNTRYTVQIYNRLFITCPVDSTTLPPFDEWMTPGIPQTAQHREWVGQVKLYNLANLNQDRYPALVDISHRGLPGVRLPIYLQHALRSRDFDPNNYIHSTIIRFVTETLIAPVVAANPNLGQTMQFAIKDCISHHGERIQIADSIDAAIALKQDINRVCEAINIALHPTAPNAIDIHQLVDSEYNTLSTVQHKAMLAFMLGTLASEGRLGYHRGNDNCANPLLYSMAARCFVRLSNEPQNTQIVMPGGLLNSLHLGRCIDAEMNAFARLNSWVNTVFDRRPVSLSPFVSPRRVDVEIGN